MPTADDVLQAQVDPTPTETTTVVETRTEVPQEADPAFGDADFFIALAIALVVFAASLFGGRFARRVLQPRLTELRSPSFGSVFSRLIQIGIVTLGTVIAISLVFPSVNVATILGGLGVLSIAAGFAFQDILSNLLAGILLIFRQPFVSGDQIEVNDMQGTVIEITLRETRIRTFQGRVVYVPNADVYTNAITVQTEEAQVRTDLAVGVGYDSDLSQARELALEVLADVDGVADDPAPEAELVGFGGSSMDFVLRYWTGSAQKEIRNTKDRVIQAIYDAFNDAGIEFPFSVVTLDAYDGFTDALRQAGKG